MALVGTDVAKAELVLPQLIQALMALPFEESDLIFCMMVAVYHKILKDN